MQNQQPATTAEAADNNPEVNKRQQLQDVEELLLGPIECLERLEIERHRTSPSDKTKHANPFRLNSKTFFRKSQQRRRSMPSRLESDGQPIPESSSSSVKSYKRYRRNRVNDHRRFLCENPKKNSIIREAVLKLRSTEQPTCLSDNSASVLLEEACKLSISNKTKTFGHGSVTKDFKSLNISSTARVAKDDASLSSEPFTSNSFQRVRSNTMPSNLKRPTTNTTEAASNSPGNGHTCSVQARISPPSCDVTIDELASYFEEFVHIPKKMSHMAEMMYI